MHDNLEFLRIDFPRRISSNKPLKSSKPKSLTESKDKKPANGESITNTTTNTILSAFQFQKAASSNNDYVSGREDNDEDNDGNHRHDDNDNHDFHSDLNDQNDGGDDGSEKEDMDIRISSNDARTALINSTLTMTTTTTTMKDKSRRSRDKDSKLKKAMTNGKTELEVSKKMSRGDISQFFTAMPTTTTTIDIYSIDNDGNDDSSSVNGIAFHAHDGVVAVSAAAADDDAVFE